MSPRIKEPFALIAESHSPRLQRAVRQVLGVVGTSVLFGGMVEAAPLLTSIPIKFAAEQTNGIGGFSSVDGAAGVLDTVNWNNTSNQNGSAPLSLDQNGTVVASGATVDWSSSVGDWSSSGRGEENNSATGENRGLMAGYLDTNDVSNVTITVAGLNMAPFTLGYDVYVYIQGGVNGRGGTYTLGATTIYHEVTAPFDGTFVEDTTEDSATGPEGSPGSNYLVFRKVTGDSFSITSTPTVGAPFRAPVNAIEIVAAVPEPTSFAVLAVGVAGLFGRRSRRAT